MPKPTPFQHHCRVTVGEIQVMDFGVVGCSSLVRKIHEIAAEGLADSSRAAKCVSFESTHLCLILSSAGSCNQIA